MEPLADILAKLLASTAMQAAAPRVGDRLKGMTAEVAGGAKGIFEGFQTLFSELAAIPEDLQNRIRNQWRRLDAAASQSAAGGVWDDIKGVMSRLGDQVKGAAAWMSPATAEALGKGPVSPVSDAIRHTAQHAAVSPGSIDPKAITVDVAVPPPQIDVTIPRLAAEASQSARSNDGTARPAQQWQDMTPLQRMVDVFRELERRGLITAAEQSASPLPAVMAAAVNAAAPTAEHRTAALPVIADQNQQDRTVVSTPMDAPLPSEPPQAPETRREQPWWLRWLTPRDDMTDTGQQATHDSPPVASRPRDALGRFLPTAAAAPSPEPPQDPRRNGGLSGMLSTLSGMLGIGKAAAGGIGKGLVAAAPSIAATAGSVVSPAVATAGAGLAATGPVGAVVAVAASVTAALIAMPKIIKEFGESIAESNRELQNFNPTIAAAYAEFDQAAFMRKLDLAEGTSGSAAFATGEWTKTLDSLQGDLKVLSTAFNVWSAGVAVMARQLPALVTLLSGGVFDGKLLERIQKDVELMAKVQAPKSDWGDKLTQEFIKENLPGRNQVKPPIPPIGGAK